MWLLERARTGRLAFHANALPVLLPVDYAVDGCSIVIRVGGGSQVDTATRNAVVAFQADGTDPATGGQWSVSVTGMATHIADPSELERARRLPLGHAGHEADCFIRITLDVVSGRRAPGR